ncbi:methyltransferase domain-containing protein [Desulfococcaceae bacterium OttesenSCG-928-F15]|nr:methyltransferase domain-containing protein [Desulfococcaceae bacterium OttesenSCG-928-F15]
MDIQFYKSFEDKHRGSRELIKERLGVYLPFLTPFLAMEDSKNAASVIDLGCGRGEWIELLQEAGFQSFGVDIDEGMLTDCYALKLPVKKEDALFFLQTLPDESQVAVTAFHVIEHISFDYLSTLISEAKRVLKPCGLLILETPNPENIVVATNNFYLDPSHKRPVPIDLLSFLTNYYGFERIKIVRLQESEKLKQIDFVDLFDVFGGVSPDYSIVAQKTGPKSSFNLFNIPFSEEYGISLSDILQRYQKQSLQADHKLNAGIETITTLQNTTKQLTENLRGIGVKLQQFDQSFSNWTMELKQEKELNQKLQDQTVKLEKNLNETQSKVHVNGTAITATQSKLNSELEQGKKWGQSLQKQTRVLEEELSVTQSKMNHHDATIAEIKNRLDDVYQEQLQWLRSTWEKIDTNNRNLTRENTLLQAENIRLEKKLAMQDESIAALKENFIKAKEEIVQVKTNLDNKHRSLSETIFHLQAENEKLENDLLSKNTAILEYEQNLSIEKNRTAELEEELDIERQDLTHKLALLRTQNIELTDTIASRDIILTRQKQTLATVENQLSHIQKEFADSQQKIHALQNKSKISIYHFIEIRYLLYHWQVTTEHLHKQLNIVYGSYSWKTTWPLRQLSVFMHKIFRAPQNFLLFFLKRMILFALNNAVLREKSLILLQNRPGLKTKLKQIATDAELVAPYSLPMMTSLSLDTTEKALPGYVILEKQETKSLVTLSPSARKIYDELQVSINKYRKK